MKPVVAQNSSGLTDAAKVFAVRYSIPVTAVDDMLLCGFNAGLVTGSNKFLAGFNLDYRLVIDEDGDIVSVDV